MKMKAKITETGTVNGRTYHKGLVYIVDEPTFMIMMRVGIAEQKGNPILEVKKEALIAPQPKKKMVGTPSAKAKKPAIVQEEKPKRKYTRKPKVNED